MEVTLHYLTEFLLNRSFYRTAHLEALHLLCTRTHLLYRKRYVCIQPPYLTDITDSQDALTAFISANVMTLNSYVQGALSNYAGDVIFHAGLLLNVRNTIRIHVNHCESLLMYVMAVLKSRDVANPKSIITRSRLTRLTRKCSLNPALV